MTLVHPSITSMEEPAIIPGPRLLLKACRLRLDGPGEEVHGRTPRRITVTDDTWIGTMFKVHLHCQV